MVIIDLQAIFVISLRSLVYTWACRQKGPVYVAMFNPLGMVIALGMGFIFLGDPLYLGRYAIYLRSENNNFLKLNLNAIESLAYLLLGLTCIV